MSAPAAASPDELGQPVIRTYGPRTYGASPQNWAVLQDGRGLLYVGNNSCVLEYDGARWRTIPTPQGAIARSLALGADGHVYVGSSSDLGYLAPDERGSLRFVSLLGHVPEAERAMGDVWKTHALGDAVYFQASGGLYRWRDGAIRTWRADPPFHFSFLVGNALYVRQVGVGLLRLDGEALVPVPGGDAFADERVYAVLPMGEAGSAGSPGPPPLLVATRTRGLFVLDGAGARPLEGAPHERLVAAQVYHGARLPDGGFALATLRGGVVLLDPRGRLRGVLDRSAGLPDDKVGYVHVDREGGLWMGLGRGLARVQLDAPLTVFRDAGGAAAEGGRGAGPEGRVMALARHEGRLYAATDLGVYVLEPAREGRGRAAFAPVPGVATQAWSLLSAGGGLLVATNDGVFEVRGGRAERVLEGASLSLATSRLDPGAVLVGQREGLVRMRAVAAGADGADPGDAPAARWRREGPVPGGEGWVQRLHEAPDGAVWASLVPAGLLRVRPDGAALRVDAFGPAEGLPAGFAFAFTVDGAPLFATEDGLYRLDAAAGRLAPWEDGSEGRQVAARNVTALAQDAAGDLWVSAGSAGRPDVGVARRGEGGAYRWDDAATRRVPFAYTILTEAAPEGSVTWLGTDEGVVRFDGRRAGPPAGAPAALVRRVARLRDGEVLYDGARPAGAGPGGRPLVLPYGDHALRFELAAPTFVDEALTRYRFGLEGFDEAPTGWSRQDAKEYTNLPEGTYRFTVAARGPGGLPGSVDAVALEILPPWYRTWWAFGAYGLAGVLLLTLSAAGYGWRLRRQNVRLEAIVRERTEELRLQNAEIRRQAGEIERQNAENERLLLNILPAPIAARLKAGEQVIADAFEEVSVLFADVVGFTTLSSRKSAHAIVEMLDALFSDVDELAHGLGVEKIKTLGDGYMAVGGLPVPRPDHAEAVAELALAMMEALERFNARTGATLAMRVGLHTGPVVAGVIGSRKFSYDLWGDTVNVASRMESTGLPGRIQVSEAMAAALRDRYVLEPRGEVEVKGKGAMRTWLVVGRR